jgi:GNAT superfamily N-acetyltransferase
VLREVAENPNSFVPLGPGEERIATDRYTLCMSDGKTWNTVQRQRFDAEELDEVLAEIRALLAERGRPETQWEIGTDAEPAHLVELLLARGLVRDSEPFAIALALRTEPPAPSGPVLARRVASFEEYLAAREVQAVAFGMSPGEADERRENARRRWESSPSLMHAVWLEGEIVGAGTCAQTSHGLALFGGATLERARGRGVYRALIHARWQEAVSRGTPALLTQAGAMSRPILERLGFERVGRIEMLLDRFGEAVAPLTGS